MRKPIAWPVLIAVVIAAASLSAHHSFVVFFDDEKIIEVKGTVTDFRFTNPHAIISLSAKNKQGSGRVVEGRDQCGDAAPPPRLDQQQPHGRGRRLAIEGGRPATGRTTCG